MKMFVRLCVAVATSLGVASCDDTSDDLAGRSTKIGANAPEDGATAASSDASPALPVPSDALLDPVDPALADTSCAANAVDDPPEFVWTYHATGDYYSGELEVSEATFTINGSTLTTRAYRQPGQPHSIPGPTIRMVPGNKYVLRFHNELPYEPLSTAENVFKDPNASNVHTHGLHISGESPGDDVTRTFPGGFGGDFVYDIPADHMGGTYWYHAHHHGSTYLQVSGGTFGLIVIDDGNDGLPQHVADMTERNIVLGYLDPGVAGTGGDTLISGNLSPTWTVNGQKNPSLCIPANEWQHWRVLLADRDAKPKTVSFGAGCEVALMARDGVWRTQVPGAMPTRSISLTGASRADFAVRCSANATLTVANGTVANIVVGAAGNTGVGPYSTAGGTGTWASVRPAYLRDLSGVAAGDINNQNIQMGARTVNGQKFDHHNANFTLPANKVQQWSLSGSAQHPFHLHVYHMQSYGCTGGYEDGEYYDVIASNCTVRFDTNAATTTAYDGRTIMHCHILEHEDQGAMGWMDLQGGDPPPEFPNDTPDPPFSDYYPLSAGSCGDATCDATESSCTCAADCGAPPSSETVCTGGTDEDCDGDIDCADADCSSDPACAVSGCDNDGLCEPGEDCNDCGNDCPSVVSGPPSNRYCCGDGIMQSAEGNGSICDGNY